MATKKTWFIAIILLAILIFQSYNVYTKSSVGYIFDTKNKVENNDVDYTLISMSADIIKQYIENDGKTAMLFSNPNGKYGIGIATYYYSYALLPYKKIDDITYIKPIEDLNYNNIDYLFSDYKAKYYIIFGKNMNIKNIITKNDISLYKVSNFNSTELELVEDFGYDLYSMFNLTEDKAKFLKDCHIFKDMIDTYWDFTSIDLVRNFAINLYDNNYINESEDYLEYYYNTVDSLSYDIDFRLANIKYINGEYEDALKVYRSALNSVGCDNDYINSKISEIEQKVNE